MSICAIYRAYEIKRF